MPLRATATNLSAAPGELSGTLPAEFGAANSHNEYAQQPEEGSVSCGQGKSQPATCMTTPTGKGHGPLIDAQQYSLHREAVRDQAANARHQTHAQYDRYVVGLQREHQRTLAQRALSPLVTSPLKPHQVPVFSTSPPLPTAANAPHHSPPPPHVADSFSWSAESESYSPAPRGPLFPPRGDNRPSGSPGGPGGHFHREEDGGDLPLHSIAWEVSVYSSPNVMSPLSSAGSGVWVRVEPSDNRRPAAETLTAARQLMANSVLPAQSCHAPAQQPPLFPPPHVDGLSKNEFISLVSQYF